MNNNLIYTSNYVRSVTSNDKKNKNNNNNKEEQDQEKNNQQSYIMNKGIKGNSNKILDINNKVRKYEDNKNIRISRVNIDSKDRNLYSKNILDTNIYYLSSNPIKIISNNINNSDIIITHFNHPFSINNHIVIQGVQSMNVILENAITFIANTSYARINHKAHGIDFNTINSMYIEINGFIGNLNNNTDYNNIPINRINSVQQIFPTMSESELSNQDYYYINMNSIIANFSDTYSLSSISIIFKDINGIDLNLINANFPTNIFQANGYQVITNVTTHTYTISLNIDNNISISSCGGNSIWVSKIINFIQGYLYNNYYKIPLKNTFYNVTKIKLLSTEFPNTEKIIKSIPLNKKNNSFYWKLEQDGNTIYSINLIPGNYTLNSLQTTLQDAIQAIKRDTLTTINANTTEYSFYENTICNITLNGNNDFFSIEFFSTIFIPRLITYKEPSGYTDSVGRLIINHPNHRLTVGIIINIINAVETNSIPQDVLNNSFTIEKIIDENTYQLKLPKYNIQATLTQITNGGDSTGITFPVKSQLLFDRLDTIGNLIGFRNVGQPYSITNFSYINSNTNLYQYDLIDTNLQYINNAINLSGDNYFLMTSPIFKDSYNTGNVDNIFAKLILSGDPGSVLFNQFIQLGETFKIPIASFSEWEVYFYNSSGDLYNFGNLEHSYTLEIYEEINRLD